MPLKRVQQPAQRHGGKAQIVRGAARAGEGERGEGAISFSRAAIASAHNSTTAAA